MKKWTVLLLYPDYISTNYGEDTYLAHVIAENVRRAIVTAQGAAAGEDWEPNDFLPLLVIEGFHNDLRGAP